MKKRGAVRLSFDEEGTSGSSDEAEGDEGSQPKQKRPKATPSLLRGGLPQRQPEEDDIATSHEPEAQSLAQVAALRAALGLGQRKKEEADVVEIAEDRPVKLPASMRDIETFSEFLRLSPAIRDSCMRFSAEELTALCETAARLKFFDLELFDTVFVHLRCRIRWGQFSIDMVTSVANALIDLNACDQEVFGDLTAWLKTRVEQMSKAQRLHWLKLLAAARRADADSDEEELQNALRTTPLPGGVDASGTDDFNMCFEFVRFGFCPRGSCCRWVHPGKSAATK